MTHSKVWTEEEKNMRIGFFVAVPLLAQALVAGEPELRCEKNWGEVQWKGMTFHRYHLRANDFPPNKTYRLVVENFDGVRTEAFDYVANKKGHLILVRPDDNFRDDIYLICSAMRGERLTFLMESKDDSYVAELIPFPLEARSKKGAKLSLELRGEKGNKFLFIAENLKPYEDVELFLEVKKQRAFVKTNGTSEWGELSAIIELLDDPHGEEAKLILKREKEEAALGFVWGPPALRIVGACCFEMK